MSYGIGMKIGVLGAGTWGMALARMLANTNNEVMVWSAIDKEIDEFSKTRMHPNLPGMIIPDSIVFTKNIEEVCKNKEILLMAVPSVFVRSTAKLMSEFVSDGQVVVDVAKGIESDTLLTMSQIIEEEIEKDIKVVALSGPTHAEEVAKDLPTTIVSACEDIKTSEFVKDIFSNSNMRVYTSTDVVGVELCGAIKNVIALAAGISAGMGYGDNAKAALITRGMIEMMKLGVAMNCKMDTFYGLAGVGDLIVTATSIHSRNNKAGNLIGKGYSKNKAIEEVGMVVEGVNAIPAAIKLSEKYNVEMPIVNAVNEIVNNNKDPKIVVKELMERNIVIK